MKDYTDYEHNCVGFSIAYLRQEAMREPDRWDKQGAGPALFIIDGDSTRNVSSMLIIVDFQVLPAEKKTKSPSTRLAAI